MSKRVMGCIPSVPDPRDYTIAVSAATYPAVFDVADVPIYDQGQIGNCVMQALRSAVHMATGVKPGVTFGYGYWRSHTMRGMIPEEAVNGLCRDGIPPASIDRAEYDVPEAISYAKENAASMLEASKKVTGWSWARVSTVDEIKAVLWSSRNRPGARCILSLPYVNVAGGYWHINGEPNGYHEMAITGWDDSKKAFRLRNSWGTKGGLFVPAGGYLWCKYDDVMQSRGIIALIPPAVKDDGGDNNEPNNDVVVVRTLRLTSPYMRGDDVKHAQERLKVHGYDIKADGIFGKATYTATREFQAAKGLSVDGIIGKNTLAALDEEPVQPSPDVDKTLRADFLAYLYDQIGSVYCWGGNGQAASDALIDAMETSSGNKRRAKTYLAKLRKAGVQDIKMYDCSGLISRWLQDHGIAKSKRDCNGLWKMCDPIEKGTLQPLDWAYRGTLDNKTHVGVYLGRGMVIECKGRDEGVVVRGIDATDGYWQFFGRPKGIY